ncbi:MAG: ABC transporter ATP-binding protein [Symploca sp. SIO2C1]|nr:ABC transporter ATP-binding protein [Symploca sp. SIO2C1]
MAQVILENVYKSFPTRQGESTVASVTNEPLLTSTDEASITTAAQSSSKSTTVNILRRINLTVQDGEFMVLVGPSGCGKSTLLRIIAGLEMLTGGKIWVDDALVNDLPAKERNIAMVFQNYALYPHFSVYENIAFGLRLTSREDTIGQRSPQKDIYSTIASYCTQWTENLLVAITRYLPKELQYFSEQEKAIDERVHYVAELLQIEPLLNRLPKQLSGGQKQRVALGRAISRNPQVFLMDEPLSNLDAQLRNQTRAQIVKLQRQLGTTTIYVTHDQTEAMTMGDRIAVMNHGEIQQIAPPLELYNQPANQFVAQFIGSPSMNFLPVKIKAPLLIHNSQFRLTLPEVWKSVLPKYDGRTLNLGIRPEHLNLSPPATKNLSVQVNLVEALGNDTYLSVTLTESSTTLQVRIPPEQLVKIGEKIWLSLTPDKIHLFDPQTHKAIRPI